jgi:hypothetical protein
MGFLQSPSIDTDPGSLLPDFEPCALSGHLQQGPLSIAAYRRVRKGAGVTQRKSARER